MVNFSGKTFVVTGGASGLGAAVVKVFAAGGANVVILDTNEAGGQLLAAENPKHIFFPGKVDVTSPDEVSAAIQRSIAQPGFSTLAGAITCAGIVGVGWTAALPDDEAPYGIQGIDAFRKVLDVNVIGSFNVAQQVAQVMIRQPSTNDERGAIVMTSSYVSTDGQSGSAAYSASKGAISSMVLVMARDLARYGIRVNAVAPGVFLTPINDVFVKPDTKCGEFPSRPGWPDEFARFVEHIFQNEMINGAVLRQDAAIRGGISID